MSQRSNKILVEMTEGAIGRIRLRRDLLIRRLGRGTLDVEATVAAVGGVCFMEPKAGCSMQRLPQIHD